MITKIINGKVITDKIEEKTLYIKDGKILDITDQNFYYDKLIDASGLYISPGFLIDIHTHGAGGFDFMDGALTNYKSSKNAFNAWYDIHYAHFNNLQHRNHSHL